MHEQSNIIDVTYSPFNKMGYTHQKKGLTLKKLSSINPLNISKDKLCNIFNIIWIFSHYKYNNSVSICSLEKLMTYIFINCLGCYNT